jgi:hypothetical protein
MTKAIEPIVIFSLGIILGCSVLCTTCLVKMAFFESDAGTVVRVQSGESHD